MQNVKLKKHVGCTSMYHAGLDCPGGVHRRNHGHWKDRMEASGQQWRAVASRHKSVGQKPRPSATLRADGREGKTPAEQLNEPPRVDRVVKFWLRFKNSAGQVSLRLFFWDLINEL